ncbi:hypothetical protein CYMTET_46570 [Cymbomonas tetramitiformis]|uniref:Uncharacterized protein n=1 Tax=Cymbomonas tetramitiformis TaxID=36881 RepID=A0AAE0BW10_9CHLO|nr:hypothetical protein CYMTET_46570 [Cymbomonas tetramitiformis]
MASRGGDSSFIAASRREPVLQTKRTHLPSQVSLSKLVTGSAASSPPEWRRLSPSLKKMSKDQQQNMSGEILLALAFAPFKVESPQAMPSRPAFARGLLRPRRAVAGGESCCMGRL